ncbi:MAG: hypothetical protein JXA87_03765 [Thermoleophilia bacterium]|nr:hypothetical protein [Thermoleophilia bacterium]
MRLAEFKSLLADLEETEGFGPDTQVFIDDPAGGLQEPVLYTSEKLGDGSPVVIIETPKDTIDEVI